MNRRTTIQQELESLNSSLPSNLNEPVFTVPDRYFEDFAGRMLALVRAQAVQDFDPELHELAPTLAGLPRKMPLTVPENYFESLSQDVPVLMRSDDALPSILSEGDRKMPFAVPDGYFDGLADQMRQRVTAEPAPLVSTPKLAPVVPLFTKWRRLAVAASLVATIAVGGWLYRNGQKADAGAATDVATLNDVSTPELDQFIQSTDAVYNGFHTVANNATAQKLLQDVSKEDLDAFLQEVPTGHDL